MVTVRAPATSANLGSGFDVFGVALSRPADVVRVSRAAETSIEVSGVPESADIEQVVETVGNAATLTAGMCRDDPELVGAGMHDSVVTPARAELIEGYDDICVAARDAGATGVTISGSGPGVLAVCRDRDRRPVASAMLDAFEAHDVDARSYQTRVGEGAQIL